MPTQLTIQTGFLVTPTANVADATGNYVIPGNANQKIGLRVTNGSAGSINVVLDDPNSLTPESATAFNPDATHAVAAGASRYVLLDEARIARFKNKTTNRIDWTYSAATSVTVEVVGV